MATLAELRLDEQELRQFMESAQRPKVKDLLMIQLRKLETEISNKASAEQKQTDSDKTKQTEYSQPVRQQPRVKTVDIKTYAWDQSDKFMKIYATVDGVQDVPKEQVSCSYTDRSFSLLCQGVGGKNYTCQVTSLHERITPDDSYIKIKTNTVLIMLKKEKSGDTWPFVTKRADKDKPKKPELDDAKDPSEGLMTMMKQMYEDGDDEMKRTIAKAWTESRDKNAMTEMT